jgi:hypothetical protein
MEAVSTFEKIGEIYETKKVKQFRYIPWRRLGGDEV